MLKSGILSQHFIVVLVVKVSVNLWINEILQLSL